MITAAIFPDGDWIVAQCLDLDVATQGASEEEAVANLREALTLQSIEPSSRLNRAPEPPAGCRLVTISLEIAQESNQY